MTEAVGATADAAAAPTAGRLLREARERHGLHIAALAASIKVAPKKLELLEADRFDELPDATFTRALAQTVCRALKIEAAPVMRLLPPPTGQRLDQVGEGLNAPFRDRPGTAVQRELPSAFSKPIVWGTVIVIMAAAALYWLPGGNGSNTARAPASAASIVSTDLPRVPAGEVPGMPPESVPASGPNPALIGPGSPAVDPGPSAKPATLVPASMPAAVAATATLPSAVSPIAAAVPAGASAPLAESPPLLQVRTSASSWVEVTDARGRPVLARLLQPGEAVGVDGALPLRIRIGNATGTRLVFRGQPTDLAAYTRDNVARLELP